MSGRSSGLPAEKITYCSAKAEPGTNQPNRRKGSFVIILPNSEVTLLASPCLAPEEDAADETVSSESTLFIHLFLRLPSGDAESTREGVDLAAWSGLV